ncbi:MAG: tetratricopeptide repeat protein, partial [Armatimonadota bacterium]
ADYCAQRKLTDERLKALKRVVEINPKNAAAHRYLASIYGDRGQTDLQIEHLRKAADLMPRSVATRVDLASVYEKAGRTQDAIQMYNEVLKLDAQNAQATEALRRLRSTPQASQDTSGQVQGESQRG